MCLSRRSRAVIRNSDRLLFFMMTQPLTEHRHSRTIESARALLEEKAPHSVLCGLRGSAPAYAITHLHACVRRPFLVVASSGEQARVLYKEMCFFYNNSGALQEAQEPPVFFFPSLETHPYENVLSHSDVSAARLWTLYRLYDSPAPAIVVTSIRAVAQRLLPAEILLDACSTIRCGDSIDRDHLCALLAESGYTRASMVQDRGDFSIRGEIIDIFPAGYDKPVRVDFFDDVIESIRLFDPDSQRSCHDISDAVLVPVREILLNRKTLDTLQQKMETDEHSAASRHPKGRAFVDNIANGLLPAGVEYSLSLLYPELETLFDYIPSNAVLFQVDKAEAERHHDRLLDDISLHYQAAYEERRVVSPPESLFLSREQLDSYAGPLQHVTVESWDIEVPHVPRVSFETRANTSIKEELIQLDSRSGALVRFVELIEHWFSQGMRVVFVCHTRTQSERLSALLDDYGVASHIAPRADLGRLPAAGPGSRVEMLTGSLSRGFQHEDGLLAVVTEEEIFGEKRHRISVRRRQKGIAISDFSDLREGDLVVHRDSGIGRYRGLRTLDAGGMRSDYISVQYQGSDKLYIPVDRINLLQKHEGADAAEAKLDKLGGASWKRTKKKVREAVEKVARDLIELYSARKVYKGHAFSSHDHYYREFEAAFPYEETPDQLAAIQDVMDDMSSAMPMDRLICGDVGYGKTEVALRAAFRAAMDGKQVAVFVPTTVLAQQHYQTFSERFAAYPVRVDILSRFRNSREQKALLDDIARGAVDIIIGTHRLISRDVTFRELGLVIIDEEHRFGVKHKEKLKKLRSTVDVLTLTATPIPRTLQLSLFGVRDFSLIETPPEDRLSIRTVITHFDSTVIREAVIRELRRGGQVFFVHNRVHSIPAVARYIRQLVPEMRLGIAHGQMQAHELERSMIQFIKKEVDVLLCTSIIESGLDFPTANTIIINNAHTMGLAQMYQLRGRVGRGKVRAYAYLLVPGKSVMSRTAAKRLEALSEFSELGSGYRLATRDLQIRGAGNILGHSQSGHIAAVGIDMYLEMLNETIATLKGETVSPAIDPEININIAAYIPETYVPNINQRLVLYRKIASSGEHADIDDIAEELRDRFGDCPEEVESLLSIARLRILMRLWQVLAVDCHENRLVFTFHESARENLDSILAIVNSDQSRFRLTPEFQLIAACPPDSIRNDPLGKIRSIFEEA